MLIKLLFGFSGKSYFVSLKFARICRVIAVQVCLVYFWYL